MSEDSPTALQDLWEAEVLGVIVEISRGECSITDEYVTRVFETDPHRAQILAGLQMLHETLLEDSEEARQATLRSQQHQLALERSQRELEELNTHLENEVARRTQELKNSLADLKQTQAQLVQSGKLAALGRMAAGVAHEVNNPLTAVLGMAQVSRESLLGERRPPDSELVENLDTIIEGALQCQKIVENMLSFSRKRDSRQVGVRLGSALDTTLGLLRANLMAQTIVVASTQCDADIEVAADAGELQQILMNLFLNAADAMEGGGVLTIASQVEGASVLISISDTGVGIEQSELDKIFEPFYTTKGAQGTGLGLSLVYGLVSKMAGSVQVRSSPKGTTFELRLPLQEGQVAVETVASDKVQGGLEAGQEHCNVLLVDDYVLARRAISRAISSHCRVTTAQSGEEAMECLRRESFDVLVTDYQMGEMNGLELIRASRAENPELGAVLITGHLDVSVRREGRAMENVRIMHKPPDTHSLRETILELWTMARIT